MAKQTKTTRKERVAQRKAAKRNRTLYTWAGIAAFIAILAFATWTTVGNTGNSLPAESVTDPALGAQADAEGIVEIVEYSDFGCPACRSWHNTGIRDQVLAEFSDRVRFVWKDFPVITRESPQAAEAGHCAAAQGKFWEFHDEVYENHIGLGEQQLQGYATAVGLNLDTFNQCLADRTMALKVQAGEQEARRLGMRGTPGFMVNDRRLDGPPNYEMLAALITQALASN